MGAILIRGRLDVRGRARTWKAGPGGDPTAILKLGTSVLCRSCRHRETHQLKKDQIINSSTLGQSPDFSAVRTTEYSFLKSNTLAPHKFLSFGAFLLLLCAFALREHAPPVCPIPVKAGEEQCFFYDRKSCASTFTNRQRHGNRL